VDGNAEKEMCQKEHSFDFKTVDFWSIIMKIGMKYFIYEKK